MRDERTAAPPRTKLSSLRLLGLLVLLGCEGGPTDLPPGEEAESRSFTGTYELHAVDQLSLPTPVRVGFMGATMHVGSGALVFAAGHEVELHATGPLGSAPDPVSLGTGGTYLRVGADSLRTTTGLEGRVWGDSAEIRTALTTVVGAHLWRYVRVPGS